MKKKKQMPKKLLKKLKKKRAKRMRFDSTFIRLLNNLNTNIVISSCLHREIFNALASR
jgi:hypothetical protein